MKNKKKIFLIVLSIIIILSSYFYLRSTVGKNTKIDRFYKTFIDKEQIEIIKKYFFPYKLISQQSKKLNELEKTMNEFVVPQLSNLELSFKATGLDIQTEEKNIRLSNGKFLNKYKLLTGFNSGIKNKIPGSGYIDFHNENLFVLSSRGILAYSENLNNLEKFKQIKNNINDFIGLKQFQKSHKFSIKDLLIDKNKIYISYTDEIEEDCWNTSLIHGNMDYETIEFKKLFSSKQCIFANLKMDYNRKNIDAEFEAHQSGGRIIGFEDDNVLLSIGDYRARHLAQDKESVNGKVVKINTLNNDYQIISMGHRNPQGLYYDKENYIILETEHGPQGGDEINLIDVNKINKENILNYGWAISSAGEHYRGRVPRNEKKYLKYPLYKSHSKHGFIEPLKSFVPSIGISEIIKINHNQYLVSSLKDKSLYFFELDNDRKIINMNRVEISERIRDLKLNNNKLYLFLEDTASIGIISL